MSLNGEMLLESGEFGRLDKNTAANFDDAESPCLDLVFQMTDADSEHFSGLVFGEEFGEIWSWRH